MHLTSQDLDDLIEVFEQLSLTQVVDNLQILQGGITELSSERKVHLLKMFRSERWARSAHARSDAKRIAEAEAAGRIQRSTYDPIAARMPATWTGAPREDESKSRLKAQTVAAKDGEELLASLGIDLGADE